MQILDGTPLRFGGKTPMSVTQAKFEQKGNFYLVICFSFVTAVGLIFFVAHSVLLIAVRAFHFIGMSQNYPHLLSCWMQDFTWSSLFELKISFITMFRWKICCETSGQEKEEKTSEGWREDAWLGYALLSIDTNGIIDGREWLACFGCGLLNFPSLNVFGNHILQLLLTK